MKPSLPTLKIPEIKSPEEYSPKSEELREGIETRQHPFLFHTNKRASKPVDSWEFSPSKGKTNVFTQKFIKIHQVEIEELKAENNQLQHKIECSENEIKALKRLRILLREKERYRKELEKNLEEVYLQIIKIRDLKNEARLPDSQNLSILSYEFYKRNPPQRVWKHPAPDFCNNISRLKEMLKTNLE